MNPGSLKRNHEGWFIRVIPAFPTQHQQEEAAVGCGGKAPITKNEVLWEDDVGRLHAEDVSASCEFLLRCFAACARATWGLAGHRVVSRRLTLQCPS